MSICLAANSVAADPLEPQIVPPCRVYPLVDGRLVCGYVVEEADGTETLGEWMAIMRADAELVHLRADAELVAQMRTELARQLLDIRGALAASQRAVEACTERNKELTADYLRTDRELQRERVKPRVGGKTGWVVAGGAVLALLAYIGGDAL